MSEYGFWLLMLSLWLTAPKPRFYISIKGVDIITPFMLGYCFIKMLVSL